MGVSSGASRDSLCLHVHTASAHHSILDRVACDVSILMNTWDASPQDSDGAVEEDTLVRVTGKGGTDGAVKEN